MNPNSTDLRKFAAWSGILAPALFVAVFTLEGFLRPGYDPISMYISELSLGPRGWIQITNFIVFGLLLHLFTDGVAAEFRKIRAATFGYILLAIVGLLYLLSGPFVMDPTGTPTDQSTIHGLLHGIFGGLVFLLMPICMLLFLRPFRTQPNWRSFYGWTLAIGIFDVIAVIVYSITSKSPSMQTIFADWLGLIQRTALVPFMIWVFIFALRLLWEANDSRRAKV